MLNYEKVIMHHTGREVLETVGSNRIIDTLLHSTLSIAHAVVAKVIEIDENECDILLVGGGTITLRTSEGGHL